VTRESRRPKGDESCAEDPHDCRKVILQLRCKGKRVVKSGNTVAIRQKGPNFGAFAAESHQKVRIGGFCERCVNAEPVNPEA
jgi:hypothetical protein